MSKNAVLKTIGVCGSQASGKTVYLCMLTEELRKYTRLRLFAADERTKRYVKDRLQWFRGGSRAPGTQGPERLRFSVEKDEGGVVAKLARFVGSLIFTPFQLHFDVIDTAGGHFEDAANLAENPNAEEMKKLIDESSALLWFIDPMMLESPSKRGEVEDQAEILYRLLRSMPQRDRPARIAAILTKQDYFKGEARERLKDPKAYLRSMLGEAFRDLEGVLEDENFKAFSVSAWGDYLGGQAGSDFCDPPARLEPVGVVDPFRWAIEPLTSAGANFGHAFTAMLKHHPLRAAGVGGVLATVLAGGSAAGVSAFNFSELPSVPLESATFEELREGYQAHDDYLNAWYPTHMLYRQDAMRARASFGESIDTKVIANNMPADFATVMPDDLRKASSLSAHMLTDEGKRSLESALSDLRESFMLSPQGRAWAQASANELIQANDFEMASIALGRIAQVVGGSSSYFSEVIDAENAQRLAQIFIEAVGNQQHTEERLRWISFQADQLSAMLMANSRSAEQLNAISRGASALLEGINFTLVIDKLEIDRDHPPVSDSIGSPDPYLTITWDDGTEQTAELEDTYEGNFAHRIHLKRWKPEQSIIVSLSDVDMMADDTAAATVTIDRWDVFSPGGAWFEATGWKLRVIAEDLSDDVKTLIEAWLPKAAD